MLAIALSLFAAVSWGSGDFIGGVATKRLQVPVVLLFVEGTGLLFVIAGLLLRQDPFPSTAIALESMAAGVAGMIGLGSLYRALAVGTMSIVAPISACGVALPVVYGLASGDTLSAIVAIGLGCAFAGIVLASLEVTEESASERRANRQGVLLALLAALGFGTYFVLADRAAQESVLWLLLLARCGMLPFVIAAVLIRRMALPGGQLRWVLLAAGTLDVLATGLYGVATTKGQLSIVSVIASLFPVVTVLLARAILHERLHRLQLAGVVLAFTGVALIAAG
ncbi:MAG TPA: DMT family transporter [Solirubrobacteraceae bacterium]|nr:DMT family transporter [Solirubrobacteraceae bacterium]